LKSKPKTCRASTLWALPLHKLQTDSVRPRPRGPRTGRRDRVGAGTRKQDVLRAGWGPYGWASRHRQLVLLIEPLYSCIGEIEWEVGWDPTALMREAGL